MTDFSTVVMTYNLWGRHLWPEREPALRAFLAAREPDILAVQELYPEVGAVVDDVLPRHVRVHDEFEGWSDASGGNIWWRSDLYRLEDHGAEDIGIRKPARRLFWARLRSLRLPGAAPLLLATAHFSWAGYPQEEQDAVNPRIAQAERTVVELDRLAGDGPCLFVGDLNDEHHPVRILRDAGFADSFTALGTSSPITSPVMPILRPEGNQPPKDIPRVIDYQFHRGRIRVRTSEVCEFFHERVAPSDHKPVVATYTLFDGDG